MKTLALAIAGVTLVVLQSISAAESPRPQELRFVFITCCRDEAFFNPVRKGMEDAARAMNA